jgi:hypothetical protein
MWTIVPNIYNAFTAPHIQTSIFIWTYLPCYCTYHDNSMRVILHSWCQIQRTSSSLRYATSGPGHIQRIFRTAYLGFNIQLKVAPRQFEVSERFNGRYTTNLVPNTAQSSSFRNVNCGPGHIQCIYISAYSDFNVHLNVSALLLEISWQFNSCYTANLVPNTAHILRFTLWELWSRTYTMHLQLHIFRLQYSFESICPAIVHITTIQ